MNSRHSMIQRNLDRVDLTWRWLRLLQYSSLLGLMATLFFAGLAPAMVWGWINDSSFAKALVGAALTVTFITWIGMAIGIFGKRLDRPWLARKVEAGQPKLLDRVNTAVALESQSGARHVAPFYRRIVQQAQVLLISDPPARTMSARRSLLHLLVFAVALVATFNLYDWLSPWKQLQARAQQQQVLPTPAETSLELPPPETVVEQVQPWGEVRITDPARDLEVTKVDVVPLQIEAAANQPLQSVGWSSTLNGLTQQWHQLPTPTDPRYAVYEPLIYLDEFQLSDWDVLTYYAGANTQNDHTFASDVYFLEVRPFREDILKMPGGENGQAMQCINQLSSLIQQQQRVIRQTHEYMQAPPAESKLQLQDRSKLANAETDLSQSVEHLYAQMTVTLENKPIGDALDHLAQAESTLLEASDSLLNNQMPQARSRELGALANLVAARKAFQKSVSENPDAFAESSPEDTPPTANLENPLNQISEFRDEEKAAREFMDQLVRQQKALSEKVSAARPNRYRDFSAEQKQLQQALQDFQEQHPRPFEPVQSEAAACQNSLQQAAQLLDQANQQAGDQVQQATGLMESLADAMNRQSSQRQLADAYKLKEMLDRQIENFRQCENAAPGGGPSQAEMNQAAAETRQALRQLKDMAEQPPTRDAFKPGLRDSLSDLKMVSLNWPLSELENARSSQQRQKAAGQVRQGLEEISEAFEQSKPQAMQAAQQPAQEGEAQADLQRGLARLEGLIRQLKNERPVSTEDQLKQSREALHYLRRAWDQLAPNQSQSEEISALLEEYLGQGTPPDAKALATLLDAMQMSALEMVSQPNQALTPAEVTAIDASRLPSAYRKRIEKYFQKLSEE